MKHVIKNHKMLLSGLLFLMQATVVCADTVGQKADSVAVSIQAKVLTCPEMGMLNALLAVNPVGIVRMDLAHKIANDVLQKLSTLTDTKGAVTGEMKKILEPVKQFFSVIQQYSGLVRPLVEESLFDTKNNLNIKTPADSFILLFFESKSVVDDFFEQHVSSKDNLNKACNEFIQFFADMKASLSPEAKEAYKKLLLDMKNKKKK